MNEKIKNFMEYVSSDEVLIEELKSVTEGKDKEEQISNILSFAKKHQLELTKDDIMTECAELDVGELEAVVGGGGCGCAVYGSGSGDGLDCSCAIGGFGGVDGDPDWSSQGGCGCAVAGVGATRRH